MFLRVIFEAIVQAFQQLNSNKLRSFLSSLGITIGIFCIISVLSAVDSLESNISKSFEKLGNDVLYVDRMPWNEDPNSNWWKYMRRPHPGEDDLEALKAQVKGAEYASLSVFIPGKTIKYGSTDVQGAYMAGITYDYADISKLEFESGRYFTPFEYANGTNRVILGNVLAEELFGDRDPIGKTVKIVGRKYQVIGVLEKEGNSLVSIIPYDEAVLVSFNTAKKLVNVKTGRTWGTLLNVKARPDVEMVDLRDEVMGVMRKHRKLSMFTTMIEGIFGVMNMVGFVIGIFAILVGVFSVANIMFVSVKERTSIIGIKKALGARNSIILFEFLIESIMLCVVGGVIGLGVVMLVLKGVSGIFQFDMFVSATNITIALVGAIAIGIVAGLIPATQAARMDPVDAMRS